MNRILENIRLNAKKFPKRIVFPEGDDLRILRASRIIKDNGFGNPVILKGETAKELMNKNNISIEGIEFVEDEQNEELIKLLLEKRKHKGLTLEEAQNMIKDVNYLGVLMVESGFVDCMVSGAASPTASVLRPALQIIKTKPGINTASSFFIVSKEDKNYFFSDCALVVEPSAEELKDIALSTAESAETFGIEPKVALLSFSTKGSSNHESLKKIRETLKLVKQEKPGLIIDGELQLDAAIVPSVSSSKCSESEIKGDANVLIFPDLNSGNIGYKLVERLGGFKAIGPVIQGLKKPVNDLSRGCSVENIVDVATITIAEVDK